MILTQIFLPIEWVPGATYELLHTYSSRVPESLDETGAAKPRLTTRIRITDLPPGQEIHPLAPWRGTLRFQPESKPQSFDPLDPEFSIRGTVTVSLLPFDYDSLSLNLNVSFDHWIKPPTFIQFLGLTLDSQFLNQTILPLLRDRELAILNAQGTEISDPSDLLVNFILHGAAVNIGFDGNEFFLPGQKPSGSSGEVQLELLFGIDAGNENLQYGDIPDFASEPPKFERFPVEHLYQLVDLRAPVLLGPAQRENPLHLLFQETSAYSTWLLAEEVFLPRAGQTIETFYPLGFPSPEWADSKYSWQDVEGWVSDEVPISGRVHVPEQASYLAIEHPGESTWREASVLLPSAAIPSTWPEVLSPLPIHPPGGSLVLHGTPRIYDQAWFKTLIRRYRLIHNRNNISRTKFYWDYWEENSEVPWTLLAHLVARNAGYQMSDLKRYDIYAESGSAILLPPLLRSLAVREITEILRASFALLESANYLILYDALPGLAAYAFVKSIYDESNYDATSLSIKRAENLFNMLKHDPDFGLDPWIVEAWKTFFHSARVSPGPWWANEPYPELVDTVREFTLKLVANEQAYIEKRVVNPSSENLYLNKFATSIEIDDILKIMSTLELTKLVFPGMGGTGSDAETIFVYTVGNFSRLAERVRSGGELFYSGFLKQPDTAHRTRQIRKWAKQNQHTGSRMDYDSLNFDHNTLSAILPGGKTYSDRIDSQREGEDWPPENPGESDLYSYIHVKPAVFPWSDFSEIAQLLDGWIENNYSDEKFEVYTIREGRPLDEVPF